MMGLLKVLCIAAVFLELGSTVAAERQSASTPVSVTTQNGIGYLLTASPDHKLYALVNERDIDLYTVEGNRRLRRLTGHESFIKGISFSADSRRLATSAEDSTVRVWDVETGEEVTRLAEQDGVDMAPAIDFLSADLIAIGTQSNGIQLWDIGNGKKRLLQVDGGGAPNLVHLTNDAKTLLWITGGKLLEYDITTRRTRTLIADGLPSAAYAISPDETMLVGGGVAYDLRSLHRRYEFDESGIVYSSPAFLPDGSSFVAASSDGGLTQWDAATGEVLSTLNREYGSECCNVSALGDGSVLISDYGDLSRWWPASGAVEHAKAPQVAIPWGAAFNRDGSTLTTFDYYGRSVWDLATVTAGPRVPIPEGAENLVFSDGSFTDVFLSADARVQARVGDEGVEVYVGDEWALTSTITTDATAGSLAVSADGNLVGIGEDEGSTVYVADLAANQVSSFELPEGEHAHALSLAFSPDGNTLAISTGDGVALWDWRAKTQVAVLFDAYARLRGFSGDGRYLVGDNALPSEQGGLSIVVWDVEAGKVAWTAPDRVVIPAIPSVFSAGLLAAVPYAEDYGFGVEWTSDIEIRDIATGLTRRVIQPNTVYSGGAISPTGRTIVIRTFSAYEIYDLASGQLLSSLYRFDNGDAVAAVPEGFYSAAPPTTSSINIVRGLTAYPIDRAFQALYRPDLVAAKLAGDPEGGVAAAARELDLATVLESGPAPKARITSPVTDATISADTVTVSAELVDAGGGIGKLEWRVNGVTLGTASRGLDRMSAVEANATTRTVIQDLSLEPGENVIELVAYNDAGMITSDAATITVNWDGSGQVAPKLFVLAIGVSDYFDGGLKLNYAASDADAIGKAFGQAGSALYSAVDVTMVLDSDATAAGLNKAFSELSGKVGSRDVFVLFVAGHGQTLEGKYYFLPYDFRYEDEGSVAAQGIGQDQFQTWLASIPARKSLLLYDTCESGTLTGAATRGLEHVAAVAKMTRAMGRTVLSASTEDAPALEGYQGHGVFTFALLQALAGADSNQDGLVAITELAQAVDQSVPEISYQAFKHRQIPQMSIVGSDFPIVSAQ